MKTRLLTTLLIATTAYTPLLHAGAASSASITVYGIVPLILQADLQKTTETVYTVHEVSNSPKGYTVTIETDSPSVTYEGAQIPVEDGKAVLTQLNRQTAGIDVQKKLVFATKPGYARVSIEAPPI